MKYLYIAIISLLFIPISYSKEPVFTTDLLDAIALADETKQDVLAVFTADWCKYCSVMKKDIQDDQKIVDDMIICYIDVDKNPDLKKEYKVKTIPDYMIIRKRVELKRKVGYTSKKQFIEWLKNVK